jgi:putative redox protein
MHAWKNVYTIVQRRVIMAEQLEEVTVQLTNQKVQFTGISKCNPDRPVAFDYKPPLGDGQGYNGLELLLMSLSGCSATAIVYLLRKMGKEISGLKVNAKGVRRDQPPIKFEKIFLEFMVNSKDTKDEDMQKAIQLAEGSVCPVWQMVKGNVEVKTEYKIIAS